MISLSIAVMHCPVSARRRFNVERFIFEFGVHNIQHKVADFQVFSDWYEKVHGGMLVDAGCGGYQQKVHII